MNSSVFGVGEFKYAVQIFKGTKELPWQQILGKIKPTLQ